MESLSGHHAPQQTRSPVGGINISPALTLKIKKTTEVVGFTVGPAVLAFNLFNFNIAKNGYYFKDPAQYGIAIGVFLIALAWVARNWNSR